MANLPPGRGRSLPPAAANLPPGRGRSLPPAADNIRAGPGRLCTGSRSGRAAAYGTVPATPGPGLTGVTVSGVLPPVIFFEQTVVVKLAYSAANWSGG